MKRCTICSKTKAIDEFEKPSKSICLVCSPPKETQYRSKEHAEIARKRAREHYYHNREKKKAQVAKYQWDKKLAALAILGGKCQECGFSHPAALQFHHRDPEQKEFSLSTKTFAMPKKFPWERVLIEIQKCDLLCANCHSILESTYDYR